jgi:hypothetical protein
VSLKIDSNRNIETADQAEEILFQARLENKRAVVIQTGNGRAIRITKPNNILTQFFSDLSGQTQREQSQIREFVSSLRERDAKLINRSAQGLSNAEDDELDIVEEEEDVYQGEGVGAEPHHSDQKVAARVKPKTKGDHPETSSPLPYKISSKLAERARAEERRAEAHAANAEYVEVEKKLLEDAKTRKAEDDNTYDAKGELQQAQSLKNRASDVLQMQARENQKK